MKVSRDEPDWKAFELAVESFVRGIGGGAKITHNAKTPDLDTGRLRQRDVWVEWFVFGHYPAKALISCKHKGRALSETDIDNFNGEVRSAGANLGIIYSKSGFTKPAIEKSKKLGYHCCSLYRNEPVDVPERFALGAAYLIRPSAFTLGVRLDHARHTFRLWDEVFALRVGSMTMLESLMSEMIRHNQSSHAVLWKIAVEGTPISLSTQLSDHSKIAVELRINWRLFRANLDYTIANGSYNLNTEQFLGEHKTPSIDLWSTNPGPGWKEIGEIPKSAPEQAVIWLLPRPGSLALCGKNELESEAPFVTHPDFQPDEMILERPIAQLSTRSGSQIV